MKIGIVGSGLVGSTAAYAMVVKGIGREIVLVDKDSKRAEAEANDILHAVPFASPLIVRRGDYKDLKGSRLVIVSAGVSQKPGESRLDLLKRNAAVFREVIPGILENAPETILIIATNPVDIMTYLAAHYAGEYEIPSSRVIGTGTMLDTARFRTLLGAHLGVDAQHVHAYVVGEHGDSEVLTWSLATVGTMHLEAYCERRCIPLEDEIRRNIDENVRNAAYSIIEGKGATYYGIGSALSKLVDVILHEQRSILTVSTPNPEGVDVKDISISLPHLVTGEGILATIPIPLSAQENKLLQQSAELIHEAVRHLKGSL
ncbi:MAG: L-lactate dehydrogenase [Desulfatiglandaceae bacterium]